MDLIANPNYYNLYDPTKRYELILFYPNKVAGDQDFNALQSLFFRKIGLVLNKASGSVVRGGGITIDIENGTVICEDTVIYFQDFLLETDGRKINLEEEFNLGIEVVWNEVTHEQDPLLLYPVPNTIAYKEPCAGRLKINSVWQKESSYVDAENKIFIPLYQIKDGTVVKSFAKKVRNEVETYVASHIVSAHGDYVDHGFEITYVGEDSANSRHIMSVENGLAWVFGFRVLNKYDLTFYVPWSGSSETSYNETHTFTGDGYYELRWSPISSVNEIDGIKQSIEQITRSSTEEKDISPVIPLVDVPSIAQTVEQAGEVKTYVKNTDYVLEGNFIRWVSGNVPAPETEYNATLQYNAVIQPTNFSAGDASIYVSGLIHGSSFRVDYGFILPRADRVVLLKNGKVALLQGKPALVNPVAPKATKGLSLAVLQLEYGKPPKILSDRKVIVKNESVVNMGSRLLAIEMRMNALELKEAIRNDEPYSLKKNIWVDPFDSDILSDKSFNQTVLMKNGTIQPSITFETVVLRAGIDITLPYTNKLYLDQPFFTGSKPINQYTWSEAVPAVVRLSPARFTWVESESFANVIGDNSVITPAGTSFPAGSSIAQTNDGFIQTPNNSSGQQLNAGSSNIPSIPITINAESFLPNEPVEIKMDGEPCGTFNAGPDGKLNTTFNVPENMPSGTKQVTVVGFNSATFGETPFTATVQRTPTNPVPVTRFRVPNDPLAQTFEFTDTIFLTGIGIKVDVLPDKYIDIFTTETIVGFPDRENAVNHCRKYREDLTAEAFNTFDFEPTPIDADNHMAFVVECLDSNSEISICKLGRVDNTGTFRSTQAYDTGVALESANGVTWTPIQDSDLTFKLYIAEFQSDHVESLGITNVTEITDLILLVDIDVYVDTGISFEAILLDRVTSGQPKTYEIVPSQVLRIPLYTGNIEIRAILTTNNPNITPRISGDVRLTMGKIVYPSSYIGKVFPVDGSVIKAKIKQKRPHNSTIKLFFGKNNNPVPQNNGTAIGTAVSGAGLNAAFDNVVSSASSSCAIGALNSFCFVGKSWGIPTVITGFKIVGSSDKGFINQISTGITIQAELLINDENNPGTATIIGSTKNVDQKSGQITATFANTTSCLYSWVKLTVSDNAARDWFIAELTFYESAFIELVQKAVKKENEWDIVSLESDDPLIEEISNSQIKITMDGDPNIAERPIVKDLKLFVTDGNISDIPSSGSGDASSDSGSVPDVSGSGSTSV